MTHIFAFSKGFVPDLFHSISKAFNNSNTAKFLVCCEGDKQIISEFKFQVKLIHKLQVTISGASTNAHVTMFFYARINSLINPAEPAVVDAAMMAACKRSLGKVRDIYNDAVLKCARSDMRIPSYPSSKPADPDSDNEDICGHNMLHAHSVTETVVLHKGDCIEYDSAYHSISADIIDDCSNFQDASATKMNKMMSEVACEKGIMRLAKSVFVLAKESDKFQIIASEYFLLKLNQQDWSDKKSSVSSFAEYCKSIVLLLYIYNFFLI